MSEGGEARPPGIGEPYFPGGEARNHEAEVEAVARALCREEGWRDDDPQLETDGVPAWAPHAHAAIAALDAVRCAQGRDTDAPERRDIMDVFRSDEAMQAFGVERRSPKGEDHEAAEALTQAARGNYDCDHPGIRYCGGCVVKIRGDDMLDDLRTAGWSLSRASSPVSGTEPDTAKLVEALTRIVCMGDVAAAGTLAAKQGAVASAALAGFSVDASPEPDTALRRHVIEALTAAIDNASRREHFVRRIELLLDELGAAGFSVDAGKEQR